MTVAPSRSKAKSKAQRRRPISELAFLELWDLPKVMAKTSQSKPTIYKLMQQELFPLPVVMPSGRASPQARSVCWSSEEVLLWMAEQVENNKRGGPGRVAVTNVPWSRGRAPVDDQPEI